ncbi:adenine phosphoribosyltransferase [Candidatus Gastranaerophilus sp. (ex Termes propinquus)]|nr:adenine phosphoribosyltransferase [Candidatus Gastranaerophilus sp. (ex Termes propinquus)]
MLTADKIDKIKDSIRAIPDFPQPGILFRDITTALKDPEVMGEMIEFFVNEFKGAKIDYVAGVESRGFIFGMPVAYKLNCGFIPIRKPGKLPAETLSCEYALEYGTDKIEMHKDAIEKGKRVLLIDDLLATGGTAAASAKLIQSTQGELVGIGFAIELEDLKGREKLPGGVNIVSMVKY